MRKKLYLLLLLLSGCKNLETSIEEIAPPAKSKKGDGYIFFNYLKYDNSLTLFDGENTRYVLRTKAEDVERVELNFNGKKYPMVSIGKMGEFEYFEAKVNKNIKGKLYFTVFDGELKYFLGKESSLKEKEVLYFEQEALEEMAVENNRKFLYRLYIDGFYNGNKNNDPLFNEYGPESFLAPEGFLANTPKEKLALAWETKEAQKILGNFELSSWNDDFNNLLNWEKKARNIHKDHSYTKRFGGDLEGINKKISYFKEYGIETLWLSSPFYSYSGNKNDIIDYRHISPDFGVILDKNNNSEYKLLNFVTSERNLLGESLEASTWVNTQSDSIFIDLIQKFKKENIDLLVDINFEDVSERFFAFEDILKKGKNSIYFKWFNIEIEEGKLPYTGFSDLGVENINGIRYRNAFVEIKDSYSIQDKQELMTWNKTHMILESVGSNRSLIKLNLKNEEVRKYLVEASKKWLNYGLKGYVVRASENNEFYDFWEKEVNSQKNFLIKYDFSDNRSEKRINQIAYQLPQLLYNFLSDNTIKFTGEDLYTNLYILNGNKDNINFIEGLDIDRLNSSIINVNRELDSDNEEKNNYLGINPLMIDSNNLSKYRLGILLQFLLKGSPSIYYGSEKYMWGGDVPHNRKAMLWDEYFPYMDESDSLAKYESRKASLDTKIMFDQVEGIVKYKIPLEKSLEDFYKKLIKFRQENESIINNGFMDKIKTSDNLLIFSKSFKDETLIFAINKGNKEEKVVVEVGKGKKLIDLFENNHKDILKSKAEIVVPPTGFVIYKKEK